MADITPAVRADLAPTGKLRAAINYGNFILATKDKATGESRGVAIDLTQEIARRLGVPVEIVAYDSVAVMGDAAPSGVWDIAFLGSDPAREKIMGFTAAYLEIEATYLVPGASALRTAADVDREGVRVAAPARANYELYLSRNLKRAQLVSTPSADAAFELLATGKVEALAGLTQALLGLAPKLPGSRMRRGAVHGRAAVHRRAEGKGRRPALPAPRRRGGEGVRARRPRHRADGRPGRVGRTPSEVARGRGAERVGPDAPSP